MDKLIFEHDHYEADYVILGMGAASCLVQGNSQIIAIRVEAGLNNIPVWFN